MAGRPAPFIEGVDVAKASNTGLFKGPMQRLRQCIAGASLRPPPVSSLRLCLSVRLRRKVSRLVWRRSLSMMCWLPPDGRLTRFGAGTANTTQTCTRPRPLSASSMGLQSKEALSGSPSSLILQRPAARLQKAAVPQGSWGHALRKLRPFKPRGAVSSSPPWADSFEHVRRSCNSNRSRS